MKGNGVEAVTPSLKLYSELPLFVSLVSWGTRHVREKILCSDYVRFVGV